MSVNPYDAPGEVGPRKGIAPARRTTIRRIAPLSLAKLQAAVFCVLGLIGAVIWFLFALLGLATAFGGADVDAAQGAGMLVGGLIGIVVVTALYALIGFVGGAITAAVYNLAAGAFGGLVVDLEPAGYGPAD